MSHRDGEGSRPDNVISFPAPGGKATFARVLQEGVRHAFEQAKIPHADRRAGLAKIEQDIDLLGQMLDAPLQVSLRDVTPEHTAEEVAELALKDYQLRLSSYAVAVLLERALGVRLERPDSDSDPETDR